MMRFAICTSIYEAGRPFLDNWIEGTIAAGRGKQVQAIIAIDDFRDPAAALTQLETEMPITFVKAENGATPARVRAAMLASARKSDAAILVCCDMDDWLLPDALATHAAALKDRDFSYGDLQPVDRGGRPRGRTFFTGVELPAETVEKGQMLERNWLGFSNTALRRESIPASALDIPRQVLAADWWFFTNLVASGAKGRLSVAPVASYRSYEGNLIGPDSSQTVEKFLSRCDIVRRHYAHLPCEKRIAELDAAVAELVRAIESDDKELLRLEASLGDHRGVWYEDITWLAAQYRDSTKKVDSAANRAGGQIQPQGVVDMKLPKSNVGRAES